MSLSNRIVLEFGDGEYPFALNGREVEELQKLCGSDGKAHGFGIIFQRATLGAWFHSDIYQTIRLGLEGGGMDPVKATRVAKAYAQPPYKAGVVGGPEKTALMILSAAMHGFEDLPPGETETPKA
jgi:hypothetical protein